MASPDEVEMSEVNFNIELDESDDSALQCTTEHQSSGDSTAQPMSDNTSDSLLSLNTSLVCQHCSAAFVLVSSLELHLASVHGEPLPFPEWTESSYRLEQESAWSMEEDSPVKPSAVYSTAQPMSDNTSGSLLSLKRGRVCQHCSAAFVLVSSLELHLASVHGDKLHMVLPGSSTPDRCDAGNYSNTDIDKEVDSHGNRKTPKKKFDDSHTGDTGGKKNIQHVCDTCGKSFSKFSILRTHKRIHSGVKLFVCDVCSMSFTQSSGLTRHKRVHTGERPYKCPHCDSGFKESGTLKGHIRSVHESARPHVCDVCGAAFSRMSDRKVHSRIHTGEKPYVCSDCGKGFTHSGTLANHRLLHIGRKPHSCSLCSATFTQSGHLKRHMQTKHQ